MFRKTGEYIHNAYEDLKKNNAKQTILKEFLLRKDKHGLTTDDVVGLMTDFLMAGVDTVITNSFRLEFKTRIFFNLDCHSYSLFAL